MNLCLVKKVFAFTNLGSLLTNKIGANTLVLHLKYLFCQSKYGSLHFLCDIFENIN